MAHRMLQKTRERLVTQGEAELERARGSGGRSTCTSHRSAAGGACGPTGVSRRNRRVAGDIGLVVRQAAMRAALVGMAAIAGLALGVPAVVLVPVPGVR